MMKEVWKISIGAAFLLQNLLIILADPPRIVIQILSIYVLANVVYLSVPTWTETWRRYMR